MANQKYYYGGQAVVEGVMMRGRRDVAVAVRTPSGDIKIHREDLPPRLYANKLFARPFVRGVLMLWDTLVLGTRMLLYSANVAVGGEEQEMSNGVIALTLLFSLGFGVLVFFVGPLLVARLIGRSTHSGAFPTALGEGLLRLLLFIVYLKLIGYLKDVRRLFAYHGAEHKAINALEGGCPLEPERVQVFSTLHVRCGTNFLLIVVLVSIVAFALVDVAVSPIPGIAGTLVSVLSRIVLLPVVASLAYELVRLGAEHQANPVVRLLLAPGLQLQKLTTNEPTIEQLEVSIAALQCVLERDAQLTLGRAAAG